MKEGMNCNLFRMGFGKFVIPQAPEHCGFTEEHKNLISWLVQLAYENKMNVVECYSPHGNDEYKRILGSALLPFRDDLYLIDRIQLGDLKSVPDLRSKCEESLTNLQTDYLDCLSVEGFVPEMLEDTEFLNELLDILQELKASDLVHELAIFAFHDPDDTGALIDYAKEYGVPFDAILCEYNLINQHMSYSLAAAKRRGLRTFALSAVGNERLTHELSFRFVWSNRNVDVLMAAVPSESRLKRNLEIEHTYQGVVAAPEKSMWSMIAKALEGIRLISQADCGDCTACEPCPLNIPIVEWLELCRSYLREPESIKVARDLERFFQVYGNPVERCDHCKKCEQRCPQKLPIDRFMQKAFLSPGMWKDYIRY